MCKYNEVSDKKVCPKSTPKTAKIKTKTPLDTLAQLPENTSQVIDEINLKKLSKRARAKTFSDAVATKLAGLHSPLQKSYKSSLVCASVLTQVGNDFTGMYCNQRWCMVCARNRTAILINGYVKQLDAFPSKYFVTLTAPNCTEQFLQKTIKDYYRAIRLINRKIREEYKLKFHGLRKFECTYNVDDNTYHPHYHLIIDSAEVANLFVSLWLDRFPNARTAGNPPPKVANNDSIQELFKYFVKVISKSKKTGKMMVATAALDKIFIASKGMRTFQPMGIKKVSDKKDKEQTFRLLEIRQSQAVYAFIGSDWVDQRTKQALTQYRPSESLIQIMKSIY